MKMLVKYKKVAAKVLFLSTFLSGAALQGKRKGYSSFPGKKVDFLSSMEWDAPKNKQSRDQYFSTDNTAMKTMMLLKALYDKNNYFERKAVFKAKIPKIIHQIWLGPKTPPAVFKQSQESLKRLHPEWEYRLWTDADVDSITLHNQKFYNLSDNFAEKADILRYEILHQIGGVYVDVDFICFKPLDILCQYDLWAALEPLDCSQGTGVNNAIIGSIPNHALLKHCIENIQESWHTGSNLFERVGPEHFTESFVKYVQENPENNVIAFPKSFFYPLDYRQGMTHLRQDVDFNNIYRFIEPESFAMHLWAGSWRNEPSIKGNTTPLSKKKKKKKKKQRQHQKELEKEEAALQEKNEPSSKGDTTPLSEKKEKQGEHQKELEREEAAFQEKTALQEKNEPSIKRDITPLSKKKKKQREHQKELKRKKAALQEKEEQLRVKERKRKNFYMTKESSSRHVRLGASDQKELDQKELERKKAALQEKEEKLKEEERKRKNFYMTKKKSSRHAEFGASDQKELERKKTALQEKEEQLKEEERRRKNFYMTKKKSSRHAEFGASDQKELERKKAALQEKEEKLKEEERRRKNFYTTKRSPSRHAEFGVSDQKELERKKAALQEKEEQLKEEERRRKNFYTTKRSSSRYARLGAFGQWSKVSSRRR